MKFSSQILLIAFISGICGLAYEILYVNIISNYFGDMFYISASVLMTFFLGMGVGSLFAQKYVKMLPIFEISIGLYAVVITTLMYLFSNQIIILLYANTIFYPLLIVITTIIILLVPALLLGFSVPMYTMYYNSIKSKEIKNSSNLKNKSTDGFNKVYILYTLAGALCILLIEYVLLRNLGIYRSVLSIATLNLLTGVYLFFLSKKGNINCIETITSKRSMRLLYYELSSHKNLYLILVLSNIITSVYYLIVLQILNLVYGPQLENFSILIFISLFSISISTLFVSIKSGLISPKTILYLLAIISLIVFSLLYVYILSWISLWSMFGVSVFMITVLKIISLTVFLFPLFLLFGLIEPLLIQYRKSDSAVGIILGVSSISMALGFAITIFLLLANFTLQYIIIMLSIISIIAYILFTYFEVDTSVQKNKLISQDSNKLLQISQEYRKYILKYGFTFLFFLGIFMLFFLSWPQNTLNMGYNLIQSPQALHDRIHSIEEVQEFRRHQDVVSLVTHFDMFNDVRFTSFALNGYVALTFTDLNLQTQLSETKLALLPLLFNNITTDAMVLGFGSGITPGAAGLLYENVNVLEINLALEDAVEILSDKNFNVLEQENVNIIYQDGLIHLVGSDSTYDVIINTVTSPYFYSASKLWTKEAFEIVSSRLNEGGIFAAWFDIRLGDEGIFILHNTLHSVFNDCLYYLVEQYYYFTLCSNDELSYNSKILENLPPQITELFEIQLIPQRFNSISDFIENRFLKLDFTFSGEFEEGSKNHVNTLDNQLLRFRTQPLIRANMREEYSWTNYEFVFSQININPFTNTQIMDQEELELRCRILQYATDLTC